MLGFLFTREKKLKEKKLKDERKSTYSKPESALKVNIDASPTELQDTERPYELEDFGRKEMPGIESRIVLIL